VNAHVDTGNDMVEFEGSDYMIVRTVASRRNELVEELTVFFLEDNGVMPVDHFDDARREKWQNTSKERNMQYIIARGDAHVFQM
jgi:hypothetical protein